MRISEELKHVAKKIRNASEGNDIDPMFVLTLPNRLEAMAQRAEDIEQKAFDNGVSREIMELAIRLSKQGVRCGVASNSNYSNGGDAA